jgi:hypothetical protein
LRDLLRVLVALHDPPPNAVDLPLVLPQERLHGGEVAGFGLFDERWMR